MPDSHGFRIVTEHIQDPTAGATTDFTNANQYAIVALCTVEKVTDFSTAKDTTVVAPSKPQQHAADLYIEAMELVPKTDLPAAVEMMHQLRRYSNIQFSDATTLSEVAWQQRKCRRLLCYPTLT